MAKGFHALQDEDFDRYNYLADARYESAPTFGSAARELRKIKEENRERIAIVQDAAIMGGVAFGFGWVQGRYDGMPELFGLPYDLLLAIGLHGVNLAGYGGAYEEYIHSAANGALASYAVNAGARMGFKGRCDAYNADLKADGGVATGPTVTKNWGKDNKPPVNCPTPEVKTGGGGGAGGNLWQYGQQAA